MDSGALFVLIDGKPNDSALVRRAREYADAKGCSVTLLRVLDHQPEEPVSGLGGQGEDGNGAQASRR